MGKQFGEIIINKVLEMKLEGKSNLEIGNSFDLNRIQIKNLLTRHRTKEKILSTSILPKPKGRPRTERLTPQEKLELENSRTIFWNTQNRVYLQAKNTVF